MTYFDQSHTTARSVRSFRAPGASGTSSEAHMKFQLESTTTNTNAGSPCLPSPVRHLPLLWRSISKS